MCKECHRPMTQIEMLCNNRQCILCSLSWHDNPGFAMERLGENVHDKLVGLIACMLLGSKFVHVCSSSAFSNPAGYKAAAWTTQSCCGLLLKKASCIIAERHRLLHLLCITAMT